MPGSLPTFVIAGAQKSGTTSLSAWLYAHPDVFLVPGEVHFFDRDEHWNKGIGWYAERFAAAEGKTARGEKTPSYIAFPEAIERMAAALPDVQVIVSLRDPVARFYSQWRHMHFKLWLERRSIEQVVDDELRAGAVTPRLNHGEHGGPYYLARGLYLDQLRGLLEHYPRERVLVVLAEDLKARAERSFAEVCRFLGVDDTRLPAEVGSEWNPNEEFRPAWLYRGLRQARLWNRAPARLKVRMLRQVDYRPLDEHLRARLADFYAAPNAELGRFLGRDLSHWGAG